MAITDARAMATYASQRRHKSHDRTDTRTSPGHLPPSVVLPLRLPDADVLQTHHQPRHRTKIFKSNLPRNAPRRAKPYLLFPEVYQHGLLDPFKVRLELELSHGEPGPNSQPGNPHP